MDLASTIPSPPGAPFAPACERNRGPILEVLAAQFADRRQVLEIGSGTGQHAVHFAAALPQLRWQTSEVAAQLDGIRQWLAAAGLPNTPAPLEIDVDAPPPPGRWDALFTANTLHIMGWPQVERLFALMPAALADDAVVTVYGPFKRDGRFTSDSNARFDALLRQADPRRGIRDFEAVDALAASAGLALVEDRDMPANNRCVTWRRVRR